VRGSGGAACDDGSSEAADGACDACEACEAGGKDPSDDRRRGSRAGPGQSQIDRCISPVCGAADPPAVANAGVNPGSGGPDEALDAPGLLAAIGGDGGGGDDTAPAASAATLISGSSFISISAAPSDAPSAASPGAASAGLPSWPR
jgi:hypothetical protein